VFKSVDPDAVTEEASFTPEGVTLDFIVLETGASHDISACTSFVETSPAVTALEVTPEPPLEKPKSRGGKRVGAGRRTGSGLRYGVESVSVRLPEWVVNLECWETLSSGKIASTKPFEDSNLALSLTFMNYQGSSKNPSRSIRIPKCIADKLFAARTAAVDAFFANPENHEEIYRFFTLKGQMVETPPQTELMGSRWTQTHTKHKIATMLTIDPMHGSTAINGWVMHCLRPDAPTDIWGNL
jgi:hypothetical protein